MFGSEVLDVAIAIIFVFLLVSILASAIREGIEGWLKTRSTHLEAGIRELLQDPNGTGLTQDLFDHPLIYSLYSGKYSPLDVSKWWPTSLTRGRNLPSYIPSRNFALALLDLAARGPVTDAESNLPTPGPVTLESLRANLSLLPNLPVRRALLTAIDTAQGDLQKAQANVEAWYDSTMDRVSGWYKRSTQWMLLAIGLTIAITMNINTITIGNYLYRDKTARETLIARAQAATADANYPSRTYPQIQNELSTLSLPLGGTDQWKELHTNFFPTVGGWLLTAIAVSFGAPFWFDLLNRFMVIRSTVKPHQKSPEEASDDHQESSGSPINPASAMAVGSPPAGAAPPYTAPATDPQADPDGCGMEVTTPTSDEDLPVAEGGVR